MESATFAIIYFLFAGMFCYMNLESARIEVAAGIHSSLVHMFNIDAFTGDLGYPKKMKDIETPKELYAWMSQVFIESTFKEQEEWNRNRIPGFQSEDMTAARVAGYNRMLLTRWSAKRWKFGEARSRGVNSVYKTVNGFDMSPEHYQPSIEDTSALCNGTEPAVTVSANISANYSSGIRCHPYIRTGSYEDAGGISVVIDADHGRAAFDGKLNEFWEDGLFDVKLATFVADILVYNTAVEEFMHVAWSFTFDFAGNCHKKKSAYGFGFKGGEVMETWVFYCLCAVVLCFIILEIRDGSDVGLMQYLRKSGKVIDFCSHLLCGAVLGSYVVIGRMDIMRSFTFADLKDPALQTGALQDLIKLSGFYKTQSFLIAVNLLVLFVRAFALVAGLQTSFGLILRVVGVVIYPLIYFIMMYLLIMLGFVIMAYFVFGPRMTGMSTPTLAFYRCFSMMTSKPIWDELVAADIYMGPIFYYMFYLFFYLVMINMFISILLSGYDLVDYQIKSEEQAAGKKEKGALSKIADELRGWGGVLIRWCNTIYSLGKSILQPIYNCLYGCFECFMSPLKALLSRFRGKAKEEGGDQPASEGAPSEPRSRAPSSTRSGKTFKMKISLSSRAPIFAESVLMVVFFIVFMWFVTDLQRGEESYWVSEATLKQRSVQQFDSIVSFEQVNFFLEELIGDLYTEIECAEDDEGSISLLGTSTCNNENNTEQRVPVINDWNHGFLNTTFVRATITPTCFMPVANTTRGSIEQFARYTPAVDCTTNPLCNQIFFEMECLTADGSANMSDFLGSPGFPMLRTANYSTPVTYNYSKPGELGPYQLTGGFPISFGTTRSEAIEMLKNLQFDHWFTRDTTAIVVDWVTYNGNLDLFTHNAIGFSQSDSGKMNKWLKAKTFPLNLVEGGGPARVWRRKNLALFFVYAIMVLTWSSRFVFSMLAEYKLHKGKFTDWFFSDLWRFSDILSLCLSVLVITSILGFVFLSFRRDYKFSLNAEDKYQVPNDYVKLFNMSRGVEAGRPLEDDWFILWNFENLSGAYDTILTMSALNTFFISVKVVKYVGIFSRIKPFSITLKRGLMRNVCFAAVLGMIMLGFAFFFNMIFGQTMDGLDSPMTSLRTLFYWLIGTYDLEPMLAIYPAVALLSFLMYMMGFYFIGLNMFLATMLNTYSDKVGENDIAQASKRLGRREPVMIEYEDKEAARIDVSFRFEGDSKDAILTRVAENGRAQLKGVKEGHILTKVNREEVAWKKLTEDTTWDEIQPKDGGDMISMTFKDPKSMKGHMPLTKMMSSFEGKEKIQPTVKHFWIAQGAISSVSRDAFGDKGRNGEMDDLDVEDMEEEDENGLGEASSKVGKAETKKRLDRLLFSRWLDGRKNGRDGASTIPGKFWLDPGEGGDGDEEAGPPADDMDLEDCQDKIGTLRVSGHEVWLDCLITAFEREMDDESIVTTLLRTNDMQELAQSGSAKRNGAQQRPLQIFYNNASQILKILEVKAQREYYKYLQQESGKKQDHLQHQSKVMHDYICELEDEFKEVVKRSHIFKNEKDKMLRKLALSVDGKEYASLDRGDDPDAQET